MYREIAEVGSEAVPLTDPPTARDACRRDEAPLAVALLEEEIGAIAAEPSHASMFAMHYRARFHRIEAHA